MPEIHPSRDIVESKSSLLKDRKVALCITGSVAAVKCPEIARELMRNGAEVSTVMSAMAQKIIHPYLMEWATGNPVVTELTGKIEHVMLAGEGVGKADLILLMVLAVAGATKTRSALPTLSPASITCSIFPVSSVTTGFPVAHSIRYGWIIF